MLVIVVYFLLFCIYYLPLCFRWLCLLLWGLLLLMPFYLTQLFVHWGSFACFVSSFSFRFIGCFVWLHFLLLVCFLSFLFSLLLLLILVVLFGFVSLLSLFILLCYICNSVYAFLNVIVFHVSRFLFLFVLPTCLFSFWQLRDILILIQVKNDKKCDFGQIRPLGGF